MDVLALFGPVTHEHQIRLVQRAPGPTDNTSFDIEEWHRGQHIKTVCRDVGDITTGLAIATRIRSMYGADRVMVVLHVVQPRPEPAAADFLARLLDDQPTHNID